MTTLRSKEAPLLKREEETFIVRDDDLLLSNHNLSGVEFFSRREFLVNVVSGITLSSLSLGGCYWTIPLTPAMQVWFVPIIEAFSRFPTLIEKVKRFFQSIFKQGEVLKSKPNWWKGKCEKLSEKKKRSIVGGIKREIKKIQLITPLLQARKNGTHYLQIGNRKKKYSLVLGYSNNPYLIKDDWLDWFFNEDECNLEFDGDTIYEYCDVEGCKVYISRQRFRKVNGEVVDLSFSVYEKSKYSVSEWKRHIAHSPKWKGCPIVPPERREVYECPKA
jgi:hypothetical protein